MAEHVVTTGEDIVSTVKHARRGDTVVFREGVIVSAEPIELPVGKSIRINGNSASDITITAVEGAKHAAEAEDAKADRKGAQAYATGGVTTESAAATGTPAPVSPEPAQTRGTVTPGAKPTAAEPRTPPVGGMDQKITDAKNEPKSDPKLSHAASKGR